MWEKELFNAGHAVIHDKIVVIDPFDPHNCTVVLGSHNLSMPFVAVGSLFNFLRSASSSQLDL
ncbi:hypothetical protein OKW49_002826 [Paraburkholderia youngii]|uniref:hypothetical protein n=1 Tax=Paraburkholderia youngii TaxID=2782701 RepID=UPI003D1C5ABD